MTNKSLSTTSNKHSHLCGDYIKDIQDLKDEIKSLQRSVAHLRKDLWDSGGNTWGSNDRSFWIHR